MYTVYVLHSLKDNQWYIGCTSNLENRIIAHSKGQVRSTKHRLPIELLHKEEFANKYEAFAMERFYKTAVGKRVLKKKLGN
ncbi:MAG: GIY-YIG nuclease family protein [Candidatus Wildermuthbacteria bacterium]|nr:GIY-YIG nuclease family protein [Candidatus Wildermuthbacteria bacterium]MBI2626206.1 GIY-YIG nuclease family protein [Candidatus Nealsonbacteria bacterium]